MVILANLLIDGLSYGMVLFIIAVGLSVTLGLMRFVNLAHGAFAMIGGYVTARFAKRMPPKVIRNGILVWAVCLTILAFWRYL